MPNLLVVHASPRDGRSVSRAMTAPFFDAWRLAHPDGNVVVRDLAEAAPPYVTGAWLDAYFTPPQHLTAESRAELALSNELVAEVLAADHLAISTPVYNYNVPASLKAWIDNIVRKGITLGMDGKGLLTNKRATLIMASGGVYTAGSPIQDRDIATQYLKLILGVIGIDDVAVVAGGGAKAVDLGEVTLSSFVAQHMDEIALASGRS